MLVFRFAPTSVAAHAWAPVAGQLGPGIVYRARLPLPAASVDCTLNEYVSVAGAVKDHTVSRPTAVVVVWPTPGKHVAVGAVIE